MNTTRRSLLLGAVFLPLTAHAEPPLAPGFNVQDEINRRLAKDRVYTEAMLKAEMRRIWAVPQPDYIMVNDNFVSALRGQVARGQRAAQSAQSRST